MVRAEGLEPTRLAALEPKSSASANSATPAKTEASIHRKNGGEAQHFYVE